MSQPQPTARAGRSGAFDFDRYTSLRQLIAGETDATTLADQVYDKLLTKIIEGEYPAGTELKSTRMAKQLQVSRTPVNHAVTRLLADGVISQQMNYRPIVRQGAENWLVDVHQLRQQVEPCAARLAAGRLPENVTTDLALLGDEVSAHSKEAWRMASRYFDYAMHLVVAEYCGNLAMRETIRRCWRYKRLAYKAVHDTDEVVRTGNEQHLKILSELTSGDGAGAEQAMAAHLDEAATLRVHQRFV